jgi:PAS domain S-box-containing protein
MDKPSPLDQEPKATTVSNDRVFYEQALLLFRAAPTSVGGTFLGILFVDLILWTVIDHTRLFVWTGLYVLVNSLRAIHAYYFIKHREGLDIVRWSRQFGLGAISSSLFWGSTAIFLFPMHDPVHQVMLELILMVACTVAITNIAMIRYIIIGFILLTMTPIAVRFFMAGTDLMNLLGVMTLIAMGLFLIGGLRVYRITAENIRHRLEATESERQLRQSQQRLALHIKRTPLGVIEWSTDFKVTQWNRAAERIFGYSRQEALGKNGLELIVPEQYKPDVEKLIEDLNQERGGYYSINENLTRDGRTILCEWFNTTLIDDDGRVIGLASLVNDVTERVRNEQLKNEFVSTVSHELRTPLTSMRGSLGLILGGIGGELSPRMRELLQMADNNAARLHNLINDILDIQKIESGLVNYHLESIAIMPVIEQALEENQGYAQQCNVELCICTREETARVRADKRRLLQVLANLISNAIKFSPAHGQVEIDVRRLDRRLRVSVTDHGPGVSEAFRPKLFEKFSQADASSSRNFAGTGLGLSIAKGIIESHDGLLSYRPAEGGGSCFYFELPIL